MVVEARLLDGEGEAPALGGRAELAPEPPVTWRHSAEVSAVALAALILALTLPLATTVFALLLFGLLHNFFEIRYLVGRFGRLLGGRVGESVLIGLTAIVLLRLLAPGPMSRPAEIVATYALLGAVLVLRAAGRPWLVGGGGVALLAACALSLAHPDHHFVAIAHLHNVLPLVFLWEWSERWGPVGAATAFRVAHLGWAVVLPAAILAGALGRWELPDPTPAAQIVGRVEDFVRTLAPPGSDAELGGRLLVVFALLQLMHYYVWCRFFPKVGAAEAARFDALMRGAGLPHGRRLAVLVAVLAGATLALLWTDFWLGRSLYGALAGYHAYLEYALLLLFVLGWRAPGTARFGRST